MAVVLYYRLEATTTTFSRRRVRLENCCQLPGVYSIRCPHIVKDLQQVTLWNNCQDMTSVWNCMSPSKILQVHDETAAERMSITSKNPNLQWISSFPKAFYPQNPSHSSRISTRMGPGHCLMVNKWACLDRSGAYVGLWIKHVAPIKNNLVQKCQRPLRSTTPLPHLHSLHLTGFKERGPWLAPATSRECIQILYDPAVNVLGGIK